MERQLLWEVHDLTHALHNEMLHHSPTALDLTMPAGKLSSARSDQYVAEALRAALFSITRLARAVLDGAGLSKLEAFIAETRPLVVELTDDNRRHTGRNEPCPCGSGKKYKNCCMKHAMK